MAWNLFSRRGHWIWSIASAVEVLSISLYGSTDSISWVHIGTNGKKMIARVTLNSVSNKARASVGLVIPLSEYSIIGISQGTSINTHTVKNAATTLNITWAVAICFLSILGHSEAMIAVNVVHTLVPMNIPNAWSNPITQLNTAVRINALVNELDCKTIVITTHNHANQAIHKWLYCKRSMPADIHHTCSLMISNHKNKNPNQASTFMIWA